MALDKNRGLLESALDTLQDIFIVFNLDGSLVRWNRSGNKVTGYSDDEAASMNIEQFFPVSDLERVSKTIASGLEEGWASVEMNLVCKDGRSIPYEFYGMPLRDEEGNAVAVTAIGRDITQRKATEDKLRRANAELSGYAHTVAHDLKGPLTAAGSAIDMIKHMRERPLTDDVLSKINEFLDIVGRSVDRTTSMTDKVLALAQAGQAPAINEPIDISNVVRSVLWEKQALLEERGARVSVEGDLGVADMDPTHAYQVFSNLISNAIKHNDSENPEISISHPGEAEPGRLRYLVRDNGPGIPEGAEEDIFLPFHMGAGSIGTGIGLSIVHKVVRLYDGEIKAYNDGGACFEFTLPMQSP